MLAPLSVRSVHGESRSAHEATQAASHLLIAELNGESAHRHLAAYLLNAVAPSVLDRTLSSGDIDATQLADAARQLVRGITGAAQKR